MPGRRRTQPPDGAAGPRLGPFWWPIAPRKGPDPNGGAPTPGRRLLTPPSGAATTLTGHAPLRARRDPRRRAHTPRLLPQAEQYRLWRRRAGGRPYGRREVERQESGGAARLPDHG